MDSIALARCSALRHDVTWGDSAKKAPVRLYGQSAVPAESEKESLSLVADVARSGNPWLLSSRSASARLHLHASL